MPPNVMGACLAHLGDENPLLRQWACLCLSQLWHDFAEAKWQGIREGAHLGLCELATDNVPEVRAAVLYALTSFFGIPKMSEEVAKIAGSLLIMTADGSNMVRKELVIFLSMFVKRNEGKFLGCGILADGPREGQSHWCCADADGRRDEAEYPAI